MTMRDIVKSTFLYYGWPIAKVLLAARPGMSLSKFCAQHLQRGAQVLDIGAHAGVTASVFSCCVGPSGQVHAFEPNSALRSSLEAAQARSRWKNIFLHSQALSDVVGEVDFFTDLRPIATASTLNPAHVRREMETHGAIFSTTKVSTETLDQFCERENIRPQFIKIDVEGAEDAVIRGGLDTIRKVRPTLWLECWCGQTNGKPVNDRLSHLETLQSLGYRLNVGTVIQANGHFVSQGDPENPREPVPLGDDILRGPPIGIDVLALP